MRMKDNSNKDNELILFETEDRDVTLSVPVNQEMVWLSRNQMAELFDRDIKTIGKHINNALSEELDNSTVAKFATVQNDDYCCHELHEIRISEDYSRINNEETIYMHR